MTGADRELSLPGPTLFELTNIVGEAVHNAVRHGECRSVAVRLRDAHGALELEIADDGSGFDVDQVPKRGHYGIRGMRERAKALGGELTVRSTPGTGTTVSVEIPLPTANGKEERGG
jgi:signal transduction histidine kinase